MAKQKGRASRESKERKRMVVARGKVAGESLAVIAQDAGCTVRHVERLLQEPETEFAIARAMRRYARELEALIPSMIGAVRGALDAKLTDEADHAARLRAVGRGRDLLELAEGRKPEQGPVGGVTMRWTWEEFCAMRAQSQSQSQSQAMAARAAEDDNQHGSDPAIE